MFTLLSGVFLISLYNEIILTVINNNKLIRGVNDADTKPRMKIIYLFNLYKVSFVK